MPVSHGALRRFLAVSLAAAMLAIPGVASADRPIQFSDHSVGFDCTRDDGSSFLATGATAFEDGGFAYVDLGELVVMEDEVLFVPVLFGFSDVVSIVDDGTTVTLGAVIDVFTVPDDPEGEPEPAGQATIDATLTPDGPPITLTPTREGNRQIRTEGTIQPMAVSGTLTLPDDVVVDLGELECFGQRADIEVWETSPRAFVDHRTGTFVACQWMTEDGFAFLFAVSDDLGTFAEAGSIVLGDEGEESGLLTDFSQPAVVTLTTEHLSASIPLIEIPSGDPAGNATVEATLEPSGDRERFGIASQFFRSTIVAQPLDVTGTLVFPTGETFALDTETCDAADFREKFKTNPSQGPKPSGKAPVNDAPSGALPLSTRGTVNAQTGGAAFEPEVGASCAPIGATIWYRVEGTGGPITVDTAGSSFDTVAAVYVDDGAGGFEEVACVDDVAVGQVGFSWQASVTWDSVPGQTYYVQLGGFGGEFGRLRVRVS